MGFSAKQVQALRRNIDHRHVRTREIHGRELSYLEGWYTISEANRIFGFDGWNRETIESKCILARENRGTFLAVYIARVRVTVHADGTAIIREGHGTGEGRGTSPGEVHDIALKVAETDATKRALATFGKPFGLELYKGGRTAASQKPLPSQTTVAGPAVPLPADARIGFHPDDTTPIPRPSRYYGRRQIYGHTGASVPARLAQIFHATFILIVRILLISFDSLRSAFQVSYALCIRAQTPAPSPNSLPRRTATVGETGLRSLRIS